MTFFKSLILAIVVTLTLTYVFGVSLLNWFDISIYLDDKHVEPLTAISVSALIAVALVVAVLAIVLSVFGTLIFTALMLFGGLLLVGVGMFWPVLLIALIIWLCTKNKPVAQ